MKTIVIWFNPNKNIYYYRYVYNYISRYEVGKINSYGHVVVLTIDLYKEIIRKVPLRNKVIRRVIGFLHKFEKKI